MNSTVTRHMTSCVAFAFCVLSVGGVETAQALQGLKMKTVSYVKVAPLIQLKCVSCHNAAKHPESIDLSSFKALMKSGEHGPIVVAGHPEKSKLMMYVNGQKQPRMPFKQAPLGTAEIDLIRRWILTGAKK